MMKFFRVDVFLVLCLVLFLTTGCQEEELQSTSAAAVEYTLDLPDGYSTADADETGCTIYQGTEIVGGLVLTGMNNGSIKDIDDTEFRQYLDTFAPLPCFYEYVSMYFSEEEYDVIITTLRVTNPETSEISNYHHYFFEKWGCCCDLWFDDALVDDDVGRETMKSIATAAE